MYPYLFAAANFIPSVEEAMEDHLLMVAACRWNHVTPPSVEVKMYPPESAAANFSPSVEEATDCQARLPAEVRSVHVAPLSVEV